MLCREVYHNGHYCVGCSGTEHGFVGVFSVVRECNALSELIETLVELPELRSEGSFLLLMLLLDNGVFLTLLLPGFGWNVIFCVHFALILYRGVIKS